MPQTEDEFQPFETAKSAARLGEAVIYFLIEGGAMIAEVLLHRDIGKSQITARRIIAAFLITLCCALAFCPLGIRYSALGEQYLAIENNAYVTKTVTLQNCPEPVWTTLWLACAASVFHRFRAGQRFRGTRAFVNLDYTGEPLLMQLWPDVDEVKIKQYVEPALVLSLCLVAGSFNDPLALLLGVVGLCLFFKAYDDWYRLRQDIEQMGQAHSQQSQTGWSMEQVNRPNHTFPGGPQGVVRQIPKRR